MENSKKKGLDPAILMGGPFDGLAVRPDTDWIICKWEDGKPLSKSDLLNADESIINHLKHKHHKYLWNVLTGDYDYLGVN